MAVTQWPDYEYSEEVELYITDEVPIRLGYVFAGWARFPTATEAEYQPVAELHATEATVQL